MTSDPRATDAQKPDNADKPGETPPPAEAKAEAPGEAPTETPAPAEAKAEAPGEAPTETPAPAEAKAEAPGEAPAEAPAPAETKAEAPGEAPAEAPAPAEAKAEAPGEAPAEAPAPAEAKAEAPGEAPTETPAPAEAKAEAPGEAPTETPAHAEAKAESPGEAAEPESEAESAAKTEAPAAPAPDVAELERRHFEEVVEFARVRTMLKDRCSSELGQGVVERMVLLRDREAIRTCLEQTDELRTLTAQNGRLPLAGIVDASGLLRKALDESRPLSGKELLSIQATLECAEEIKTMLDKDESPTPRLSSLVRHMNPLTELARHFRRILDGKGRVRNDASDKLGKLRRKIQSLRARVEARILAFAQRPEIARLLQNPNPTVRGNRHVLAVRAEVRRQVPGLLHDRSKSGSTIFIEPETIIEDGNKLQDLFIDESAEVTRILWHATRELAKSYEALEKTTRTLAWIDFTWSKARLAKDFRLTIPETSEDRLELRDLFHVVLTDQARSAGRKDAEVVRSTVRLGEDFDMLVVTGPNTGGKTVLMKSVGLAAVMHQCGLPVACSEGSTLPVFERLYADIGDEQSIEHSLSTFSAHITRLVEVLAGSTKGTLVLIDELGAGTDPQEGAALGRAILETLLRSGALSLVTTHLGSLKDFAFQEPRAENGAMAFDIATLSPTYQFLVGQPGASNAVEIAQRLSMPEAVLARARELLEGEDTRSSELINSIQTVRLENERVRDKLLADEREIKKRLDQASTAREEAEALKATISREADLEMSERFMKLESIVRELVEDVRSGPQQVKDVVNKAKDEIDETLLHTPFGEKRRRFTKSLRKGDEVYVMTLGKIHEIQRINKQRRRVTVLVNGLPFEISFDNISWIEGANNRAAARFEMAQTREAKRREREAKQRGGDGRGSDSRRGSGRRGSSEGRDGDSRKRRRRRRRRGGAPSPKS